MVENFLLYKSCISFIKRSEEVGIPFECALSKLDSLFKYVNRAVDSLGDNSNADKIESMVSSAEEEIFRESVQKEMEKLVQRDKFFEAYNFFRKTQKHLRKTDFDKLSALPSDECLRGGIFQENI